MSLKKILIETSEKIKNLDIEKRKIIVWGMGYIAMLYENAFKTAEIKIYAYTSQNATEGGTYNECPVIDPKQITDVQDPLVIICVKKPNYISEIIDQITEIDPLIPYLTIDEFFFGRSTEIIFKNIQVLADEKSKKIYEQLIQRKMNNEMKMYDLYEENPYFAIPAFCMDDVNEVFVDMGGFVGDTLEKYLFTKYGTFKNYYIFEPDEKNYNALLKRIQRLNDEWGLEEHKIVPIFAGVGKENTTYFFKELEEGSYGSHYTLEDTGLKREIVSLDSYFKNIKVDFLKADIESYEYDMLLGAVNILKRDKPKLAISIYHNAVDMYNILNWLNNLKLGYNFYIRHHSVRDAETILYAVCA